MAGGMVVGVRYAERAGVTEPFIRTPFRAQALAPNVVPLLLLNWI
ncbi:hypothetical protein B0G73_114150 [Paraburkholderia sp. BL25I1N1]|nr:hypothetical protein B0G73_114150 [Paraburkholderia sp. BL25I1N1]